ncbi:Os01g0891500 [Oryza sativa Japonica Group]|uniref:Os01g0891500 protein n=1 Tax=Oryza sativa subsp. japonica TaxID=39947 RepID=A0A0P0VBE4_ORYSJ|nr:Os01g0891500 [Oryza sativa Japonica Group]
MRNGTAFFRFSAKRLTLSRLMLSGWPAASPRLQSTSMQSSHPWQYATESRGAGTVRCPNESLVCWYDTGDLPCACAAESSLHRTHTPPRSSHVDPRATVKSTE